MREFIYYSSRAVTAGNKIKDDLMKAGRMDIACQIVIMAFFVSKHTREDVKLHLIFNGSPDPPRHLEMFPGENKSFGEIEGKIDISKKDVASLIKRMLYKYKKGEKNEIAKGYSVEKKGLGKVIDELVEEGKEIFVLDKKGEDIRDLNFEGNEVFILGDHEGIPKHELKNLKRKGIRKISVGPNVLFASQVMTIIHNEMDRKE